MNYVIHVRNMLCKTPIHLHLPSVYTFPKACTLHGLCCNNKQIRRRHIDMRVCLRLNTFTITIYKSKQWITTACNTKLSVLCCITYYGKKYLGKGITLKLFMSEYHIHMQDTLCKCTIPVFLVRRCSNLHRKEKHMNAVSYARTWFTMWNRVLTTIRVHIFFTTSLRVVPIHFAGYNLLLWDVV